MFLARTSTCGRGGLGDDAFLLCLPLHAVAGEVEGRRPPVVLHHRTTHWDSQTGQELHLLAGAQRAPTDLGRHSAFHL